MHDSKRPPGNDAAPEGQLSRRHLILFGASALTALATAACSKSAPASCSDVSGLTPAEAGIRTTLEYQDHSPYADKTCDVCMQWVAPPAIDQCGGCKVMKGPIHPKGHCKVFAKQT